VSQESGDSKEKTEEKLCSKSGDAAVKDSKKRDSIDNKEPTDVPPKKPKMMMNFVKASD